MNIQLIELGTIIHGTLRPEDLAPAFLAYAEGIDAHLPAGIGNDVTAIVDGHFEHDPSEVLEILADAINEELPEYVWFGPLEGDPADFGVFAVDGVDEGLVNALLAADAAAAGDSNDAEIGALRNALAIAVGLLKEYSGLLD